MTLWKRGKVYWSYFYIDGERHNRSTGATNRRLAERIEQKFRDEALARFHGLIESDPDLTFTELIVRWLSKGYGTSYHHERLNYLVPFFGGIPLVRITRGMVADYRRRRHSEKKLTEATVNRDVSVLRTLLYWAVDEGLLKKNPLGRLRLKREPRIPRRMMSLVEEVHVLAQAPEHMQRIIIASLDTGMRRGETTSQLWEHIDLDQGLLHVSQSKTPGGTGREIPLTGRLAGLLAADPKDEGIVFTYEDRAIKYVAKSWKASLRRAKLRHIRFHDLRHAFNTRLMEAGVVQAVRMALMGHSSGERVHSTYTHVELPAKRRAIARLEDWVARQNNQKPKEEESNGQEDR